VCNWAVGQCVNMVTSLLALSRSVTMWRGWLLSSVAVERCGHWAVSGHEAEVCVWVAVSWWTYAAAGNRCV